MSDQTPRGRAGPRLTPGKPELVLVLACTAWFMVILDVSIVNVALPSIKVALHFSPTQLQWVVNAYTLTFAGLLLLGGRMAICLGVGGCCSLAWGCSPLPRCSAGLRAAAGS